MSDEAAAPIRVGISSCLLGQKVRFDGGHKRDDFLVDDLRSLGGVGAGVPRGRGRHGHPARVDPARGHGARSAWSIARAAATGPTRMRTYSRCGSRSWRRSGCGYVLKKDSPSCGMERVKVYGEAACRARTARAVRRGPARALPRPSGRGGGPAVRPARCATTSSSGCSPTAGSSACSPAAGRSATWWRSTPPTSSSSWPTRPQAYADLGRLVAAAKESAARRAAANATNVSFMEGLKTIATTRRNTNVLLHIVGYFKKLLANADRARVASAHRGLPPRPDSADRSVTLVRHHVRRLSVAYLAGQTYLEPHPKELMLRNHV